MNGCDPTVMPYSGVVDGFVVRCRCGAEDVAWPTREQADEHAERHRRGEDTDR